MCACTHARMHACVQRDANGDELDPWHLSELLMDVGAMSVSVDDSALGTKEESPLLHDHIQSKVRVWRRIYIFTKARVLRRVCLFGRRGCRSAQRAAIQTKFYKQTYAGSFRSGASLPQLIWEYHKVFRRAGCVLWVTCIGEPLLL